MLKTSIHFCSFQGHCVIYLKEGGPLSKEEEDGLVELRDRFTSQLHNRYEPCGLEIKSSRSMTAMTVGVPSFVGYGSMFRRSQHGLRCLVSASSPMLSYSTLISVFDSANSMMMTKSRCWSWTLVGILRLLRHTGDKDGVEYLVDKVLGGDGRFKIVKGQKLPELSDREEDGEKAQSDRDEL